MNEIDIFKNRLDKIGINLEFAGNHPWVDLTKINGIPVKEIHLANHGFTIGWYPLKGQENFRLIEDMVPVFNLIRKYKL